MGIGRENDGVARKMLPIFYVIDTSGSMLEEGRMTAVNEAMNETGELLREVSRRNADAEIKVAVMNFATGANWITKSLVSVDDFFWNDLTAAGMTSLGAALDELERKMHKGEYIKSETGYCAPVIIFMSDGGPNDDYSKALENIRAKNKWFRIATKIAIAIGDNANEQVLVNLVGNREAVIKVKDRDQLKALIKAVTLTSTMVNTQTPVGNDSGGNVNQIMEQVKKETGIHETSTLEPEGKFDDKQNPWPEDDEDKDW